MEIANRTLTVDVRAALRYWPGVIGPAAAPAGRLEPHPFARVLTGLMDLRGIPVKAMARETERSMSTIYMLRSGRHNPEPVLIQYIAESLGMSEADLRVIAGLDDGSTRQ